MSADFWAGYISGGLAIIIGNPMDRTKVRLQAHSMSQPLLAGFTLPSSHLQALRAPHSLSFRPLPTPTFISANSPSPSSLPFNFYRYLQSKSPLVAGTAAPVLSNGALSAVLFMAYNRTEDVINRFLLGHYSPGPANSTFNAVNNTKGSNLWTTWFAGAAGGVATWVISTPTELIKCRAQLASTPSNHLAGSLVNPAPSSHHPMTTSSFRITQTILRTEGLRGLYLGGVVTILRDAIGYGFYFWAYELGGRMMKSVLENNQHRQQTHLVSTSSLSGSDDLHREGNGDGINRARTVGLLTQETIRVLLCGGIAGVVTWASVYPLDVIKTRVQGQNYPVSASGATAFKRKGAVQIAKEAYREGGARVFFRGLMVCSQRAFLVNAVQWLCYEWIMAKLSKNQDKRQNEATP